MAPTTPPAKTQAGAGNFQTMAMLPLTQNTEAAAALPIALSHINMQAAKMKPMAVAFKPTRTALNQAECRRVAQKGIMAKMRMTPGPKRPT